MKKIDWSTEWKYMVFYTYLEAEQFITKDEYNEYKKPILLPDGRWQVDFR